MDARHQAAHPRTERTDALRPQDLDSRGGKMSFDDRALVYWMAGCFYFAVSIIVTRWYAFEENTRPGEDVPALIVLFLFWPLIFFAYFFKRLFIALIWGKW
jgi:hypothetical protein